MPAVKPARDASAGLTPRTSSVAATDAPRVIDPSAVMSGKAKIRKLMNTPKASSERMQPIVNVPIRRFMFVAVLSNLVGGADPARASNEFTLLRSRRLAVVSQKVQHSLQRLRFK